VGHAAAALLIMAQPLAVLATVLLPPVVMARRAPTAAAVALWVLGLALATTWGVVTYGAAVRADPADVDLLGTVHWLGLALCAAVLSVLTAHRSSARKAR
jgi:hypothetical protein